MSPATTFFLFLLVSPSLSAFVAPITKHHHHTAPFYTLSIFLKTPTQRTHLLLHLGASITTVDCTSTTAHSVPCNSPLCRSLQPRHRVQTSNCNISTGNSVVRGGCVILPHNSLALVESLALPTTNGRNPGRLGVFPEFVFSCSDVPSGLLKRHRKEEVTGLAGFGLSRFSLPAQVSNTGSFPGVFALCLSGSPSAPGVAFFDHAKPYYFLPEIDISNHLNHTPIFAHPITTTTGKTKTNTKVQRSDDEYFIGVKSININGKPITINQTLLTVDQNGNGGTRISTMTPYTVLERSIFNAFTESFMKEAAAMNLRLIL